MLYISSFSKKEGRAFEHESAYRLLEYGLKKEFGIGQPVVFAKGEYGKPYLKEHGDIYFNISHCMGWAACAISDREIGIDIERIRKVTDGVVRKALTPAEQEALFKANNKEEMFCRFWTLKESFIKAVGKGLSFPLSKVEFRLPETVEGEIKSNQKDYYFHQTSLGGGHFLAVCQRDGPVPETLKKACEVVQDFFIQ